MQDRKISIDTIIIDRLRVFCCTAAERQGAHGWIRLPGQAGNADRGFSHRRLPVHASFAGDDNISCFQCLFQMDGIQYESNPRLKSRWQKGTERVAKASGSASTWCAGITKAVDKVTFSVAPTASDRIDILREIAA